MTLLDHLPSQLPLTVIDLSGAFRLPPTQFMRWYGFEHTAQERITQAQYGLLPWAPSSSKISNLIANPGCYATCALMALLPVVTADLIDTQSIIIDAKSGVSGAGKKMRTDLMFAEMAHNFFPYKIGCHQHIPEITNMLNQHSNHPCYIRLTTHMLPLVRGILMTIYADIKPEYRAKKDLVQQLNAAYTEAYHDYPLVRFGELNGDNSAQEHYLLSLKNVISTARTHISYYIDGDKLLIVSAIDNLLKGAASQAIENINALYGMPLDLSLTDERNSK